MRTHWILALLASGSLVTACGPGEEESPDPEDEQVVSGGKGDSPFGQCETSQLLLYVNDPSVNVETLRDAGVHKRAATNIIEARNGEDGTIPSEDDSFFVDVGSVDDVSFVGKKAFEQLLAASSERCANLPEIQTSVIFSPNAEFKDSHNAQVAALFDEAERSIDVAIYSFSDAAVKEALENAVNRGVRVRMMYEGANKDRKDPAGSGSERFESMGIDVRYINKVMHHKYAIIDGPVDNLDQAYEATLISGSANWSNGAATRYDENTVFHSGVPELALRHQREFNHIWKNSRDFVSSNGTTFEFVETVYVPEEAALAVDDPGSDGIYTSDNFKIFQSKTHGPGLSVIRGMNTMSDRWVELIQGAEKSIWLASGHLRSRPIAEALIEKFESDPSLDFRIYIDAQEYLAAGTHDRQVDKLDDCIAAATSDSKRQDCLDKGFLFGFQVADAGIPLRFKYYAYRWNFSYADQMHHKYMIIDGSKLISGSYNLSDNAEHNTTENCIFYDDSSHEELINAFEGNFEEIWETERANGTLEALQTEIETATTSFPIVFTPMALSWQEVTDLKSLIRANCPDVNSTDYRTHPERHRFCEL